VPCKTASLSPDRIAKHDYQIHRQALPGHYRANAIPLKDRPVKEGSPFSAPQFQQLDPERINSTIPALP
jgi:hypothetical protein